jgi:hypothetical protein
MYMECSAMHRCKRNPRSGVYAGHGKLTERQGWRFRRLQLHLNLYILLFNGRKVLIVAFDVISRNLERIIISGNWNGRRFATAHARHPIINK